MDLTQLKKQIELKKQNYPQEWLGRSLAYTPYQPRPIKEILTKTKQYYPKNIYSIPNTKDFLKFSQNKEKEASCFLLDILENLTFVRRYVNVPLIFNYPIIDTYQILESLVFGADCIILTPSILSQKNLKELSDFAIKIGLERIFTINSKEDLSKAIFAKADILNLQNNSNLIPLIPQNKIILAQKNPQKIQGIDTYIEDF
ncbi:hypothetical protein [Helicobacter pullorum]|uniref:hypothetical protein n=1 Tax=Helicobacter pullorum TaxID=35818 RepID=UPI0006BA7AB0|nr:hypothetical protein [Helicobacter pullorum]